MRHAALWLVRLGDGTEESHDRVARALADNWRYTGEFFDGDVVDDTIEKEYGGPKLADLEAAWQESVIPVIEEATLDTPGDTFMVKGGREGRHGEHFGYLIAEMQHLKRSHPGARW